MCTYLVHRVCDLEIFLLDMCKKRCTYVLYPGNSHLLDEHIPCMFRMVVVHEIHWKSKSNVGNEKKMHLKSIKLIKYKKSKRIQKIPKTITIRRLTKMRKIVKILKINKTQKVSQNPHNT